MTTANRFLSHSLLAVMLVALVIGALPASKAYAASSSGDPRPGRGRAYMPPLERIFKIQQERYAHQTQLLERIPVMIERIQGHIDQATEKGLDTTIMQVALDYFSDAVPAAQTSHDQAGKLINTHAGFDDMGKVIDRVAAGKTVGGIHQANLGFRDALFPSFREVRQAIRTFIQDNNLRQFPNAVPAP